MNQRVIVINTCTECPHSEHEGAFGKVAYLPRCGKTERRLPYDTATGIIGVQAVPTGVIPAWCPLEKLQK